MADLQERAARLSGRAVAAAAAGLVAALLLAGCGAPSGGGAASPAAASAASSPPMDADPTGGLPTTVPPDVPEGQRTPADVAGAAMTAYIVPGSVDPDAWFARIEPYLTPQARRDYAYTDPANIPAHQLVGVPSMTRQTDYLAVVTQGTNIGLYTVSLARDDDGRWKVYRIDPPTTAGP